MTYWAEVIRDDYQCQSGAAYFVSRVRNVLYGKETHKHFISGHYIISEISCIVCDMQVGWKYVSTIQTCLIIFIQIEAQQEENKFKETNFVIEESKTLIKEKNGAVLKPKSE